MKLKHTIKIVSIQVKIIYGYCAKYLGMSQVEKVEIFYVSLCYYV